MGNIDRRRDKTGVRRAGDVSMGPGMRLALEHRWSQKLDEVIALTAACEDISAAGDDTPEATVMHPAGLRARADAACDELAELADAIARAR